MVAYRDNDQFGGDEINDSGCIFCGGPAASYWMKDDGVAVGMCLACLVTGPIPMMLADGIAEVRTQSSSGRLKDMINHDLNLFMKEVFHELFSLLCSNGGDE